MGSTVREVYRHLTFVLAVIALALLATGGPTAAADPPDPYAVPQPNPQVAQARAQALPAGAVTFDNGTNTGPPPCLKLLVPSVNATTRVFMCALVVRPPGGWVAPAPPLLHPGRHPGDRGPDGLLRL